MNKRGLGKGLGALIATDIEDDSQVKELKINQIEPNIDQPRKNFDDEKLSQLAESIKQHGIVQPIIVRKDGDVYRIVAGERRWRAARIAGLTTVPAIVKDVSNKEVMEIALIENLQREDLNPIEEAEAYERLINEYQMTQEEISKTVGKSRSAIANSIRLLGLGQKVKALLVNGELTSGHARALLAIDDQEQQEKLALKIIDEGLNVRETEKMIRRLAQRRTPLKPPALAEEYKYIEERLKNIFGTKVTLRHNRNKGKITIEYYSNDELERILEMVDSIAQKHGS